MSDLIDREKAIEDLQNGDPSELYDIEDIKYWINSLPSAEKAQLSGEGTTKDATSDLISRKELLKQIDIDSDGERGYYGDNWKFIDTIESMPSAEPERLTDDDFETIRILLNAYKEKLGNQQRWKEAMEYQRIIDRFMAFASAQSEIIRCKDCKYCEHWYADKGRCFLWHESGIDVFENGFCNYAERRTNERSD